MSEKGKKIAESLRGVSDFYVEVAKLLAHATSTITNEHWEVASSAASGSEGSKAIHSPRYWMPEDAFQFYRHKTNILRVAFVAVIFNDVRRPKVVEEPFVTAGWLRCSPRSSIPNKQILLSWCRLSLDSGCELELGGSWLDIAPEVIDKKGKYHIDQARTMAYPLTAINSETELTEMVVDPLIAELSATDAD